MRKGHVFLAAALMSTGSVIAIASPASAAGAPAPIVDVTIPRVAPDGPPIRVRVYVAQNPLAPDGPPIRVVFGDGPRTPS